MTRPQPLDRRSSTEEGASVAGLRIAIVVQGRFHAFDLARELLRRGANVVVLTNYPAFVVERFGVPRERVRSYVAHGIATRLAARIHTSAIEPQKEIMAHKAFGRWALKQLRRESWDVIHCWSGVSEELLEHYAGSGVPTLLMRGSSHIRTQARLLEEETARTGVRQDRPSRWMIEREEREYELASDIVVLSTFAYNTFTAEGTEPGKLRLLLCGVDVDSFRPSPEVLEARKRRVLNGEPLRVLNVGTFSYRKGAFDIAAIIERLDPRRFVFTFVGPVSSECLALSRSLAGRATFVSKQAQSDLPSFYAKDDIFLLPTIEDGFAVVLSQAAAAGLAILTTSHSAGDDVVRDGTTGWVLPARQPDVFVERLRWCDANRSALATVLSNAEHSDVARDWSIVARDFEQICLNAAGKLR